MNSIGSDYLPISLNIKDCKYSLPSNSYYWNFKKTNWNNFKQLTGTLLGSHLISDNLEQEWQFIKSTINHSARLYITRGNIKRFKSFPRLNDASVTPLFAKRDLLLQAISASNNITDKVKLNKLNAEIKQLYIIQKRESRNKRCGSIDARAPDSKLWCLARSFSKDQPQVESCNIVLDSDSQIPQDNKTAANILGKFYKSISHFSFARDDK
ncbi:hypothetical protein HNY73_002422 [Argiope bruennichi]|uniref:Uncharacterized protein n=1 Tax=Argiope bruennichi TaxID=94029 RepID=A0A8T0FTM1_ARGBR|nr:hypothetical protein HNY73_002422 [Argiope bruennichi]